MHNRTLRNYLEYGLFLLIFHLVRRLPRALALALGARLGTLARLLLGRRRRRAAENLRLAFPEASADQIAAWVREHFRHLGIIGIESLRLDDYADPELRRRALDIHGFEHFSAAYAMGKGVLLMTAHLGFWELGTILLPALGFPVDFVYKRMKNPFVEQKLVALRESAGGGSIEKHRAARKILRSLAANRGVAILIDQRLGRREAVVVDFFGRPANTTPIITEMAMRQGIPIVPAFGWRLPDGRYHIVAKEPIVFANDPDPQAVVRNTALLTQRVEEAVRQAPAQWFWVHDRWKP